MFVVLVLAGIKCVWAFVFVTKIVSFSLRGNEYKEFCPSGKKWEAMEMVWVRERGGEWNY